MSKLLPALQKFYNALRHLEQFSLTNSFFDNIGNLDVFLSEFRSVTLVLQKSLGSQSDPIYIKNRDKYFSDKDVSKWLNDQRVNVIHLHPFKLKKLLRVVIYDSGSAIIFKEFEQTIEDEKPFGEYEQMVRNTLLSIVSPEISFSAQYHFVDEEESNEVNVFDYIEPGVVSMWKFLHAMKSDLVEEGTVVNKLMNSIDELIQKMPPRWQIDSIDYCYYRATDSFERGTSLSLLLPEIRVPVASFVDMVKGFKAPVSDFFDAFIWLHSWVYIEQKKNLMSTFFIEYNDATYQTISFTASLRTTMYRYMNRVAKLIINNDIVRVYFVSEMVGYTVHSAEEMKRLLQKDYREREALRTITQLAFYMISSTGSIEQVMIDAEDLIDRLSISAALGSKKHVTEVGFPIMLTPIVRSFKEKYEKS